jgi:adenylate cyclase
LPQEIADILMEKEQTIAKHYNAASVVFTDIVEFTPLTEQMAPEEMIDLLNDIYSHFDKLVDRYGLEKIRTIGDSYMVVSGAPNSRKDHAQAAANLALEILKFAKQIPPQKGHPIEFRVGINSGPLIAGVIGEKKFQYDVWGDTVNTASRMESHGVADKIQVTAKTYRLLKDEFILEPVGMIDVKGKGKMKTWYLVGKNQE